MVKLIKNENNEIQATKPSADLELNFFNSMLYKAQKNPAEIISKKAAGLPIALGAPAKKNVPIIARIIPMISKIFDFSLKNKKANNIAKGTPT